MGNHLWSKLRGKGGEGQNCISRVGNTGFGMFRVNEEREEEDIKSKLDDAGWCNCGWFGVIVLHVIIVAFWPFRKEEKSILCQPRQKGS